MTAAERIAALIVERDVRLMDSYYKSTLGGALNAGDKAAWAVYRVELQKMPSKYADPDAWVWPVGPNG